MHVFLNIISVLCHTHVYIYRWQSTRLLCQKKGNALLEGTEGGSARFLRNSNTDMCHILLLKCFLHHRGQKKEAAAMCLVL